MKNKLLLLVVIVISVTVFACNNSSEKNKSTIDTTATNKLINSGGYSADSAFRKGATLIVANDCFTCHDIQKKMKGPSYTAIANKYPFKQGVVENLSSGIIKGSKGIWGQEEMTPHPNITHADAEEMVRYILSLKTNG